MYRKENSTDRESETTAMMAVGMSLRNATSETYLVITNYALLTGRIGIFGSG